MEKSFLYSIFITKQKRLLLILITTLCIFIIYYNANFLHIAPMARYWIARNNFPLAKVYKSKHSMKQKVILYWNTFFGATDMGFGSGSEIFRNCLYSSCFATANRSFLPVEQFDAIIFHGPRYSIFFDGYPEKRSIHQKYIYYSLESPYNINFDVTKNYFYNWTMTYRRDSDIHSPYSLIEKVKTHYESPSEEEIRNKSKKVAWFVSNCKTEGSKRRMKYAMELNNWIPVDIYGYCGTLSCTNKTFCYEMLEKDYKFYLSFENSFCEDYVTEKLFNILKYNVVPIILGFFDYSEIAPPKSFINTNDFKNPKDLAKYLLYLDDNVSEYLKYFEWKKDYKVINTKSYTLCQICESLNLPLTYSSYENIEDWFYGYKCVL